MFFLFDDLMFIKFWENRGDESEGFLIFFICLR